MAAAPMPAGVARELYDALLAARTWVASTADAEHYGPATADYRRASVVLERVDGALADASDYLAGGNRE